MSGNHRPPVNRMTTHKPSAPSKPPLKLTGWLDLLAARTTPAEIVGGLLGVAGLSCVYGPPGVGKSFWVLDLAIHVAASWTWRDRPIRGCGVVYLALEGVSGIAKRVEAFKRVHVDRLRDADMGLEHGDLPFQVIAEPLNLRTEDDGHRLIEAVKEASSNLEQMGDDSGVGMVVIDTLSRGLAGGDENSSIDMGQLVAVIDRVRQETGAHVLLIHHVGKDLERGARGHSLLTAALDTAICVTRDEPTSISTGKVTKQREGEVGAEFAFHLERVALGNDCRGNPLSSCVVRKDEPPAATAPQTDADKAFKILDDLVVQKGATGFPGAPEGVPSVPLEWVRDGFYAKVKSGAEPEARKKAFQRAREVLTEQGRAGFSKDRAWLIFEQ